MLTLNILLQFRMNNGRGLLACRWARSNGINQNRMDSFNSQMILKYLKSVSYHILGIYPEQSAYSISTITAQHLDQILQPIARSKSNLYQHHFTNLSQQIHSYLERLKDVQTLDIFEPCLSSSVPFPINMGLTVTWTNSCL